MPKEEKENAPIENYPLEWTAPGRPFKKRSKQFYLTALLIMLLVEIIMFLFSQYLLMIVVISLVFVAFSLAAVPPKDFHYRISSEGVMIEDGFFIWRELYDFYFKDRDGVKTLHLGTHAFLPGELIVTLGDMDEEIVKDALIPYLSYREYVKPTVVEKSADWLVKNFPLEKK
jgi:uncharacterized membrane protein YdbT with pleckstrin-like domain